MHECLIPTSVVLILAVISKRTIEPLVAGTLIGLLILAPSDLMDNLSITILKVMRNETIGWVIMVCGLMGSLIALLVKTGGALAFGSMVTKRIKSRASALLTTWLLGLAIFIDDYLNTMVISSSMKKVTDRFGVSREMLAYIVDSTAAPICIIVPLSTWAVYFAAVLAESMSIESGQGLSLYTEAIPYMFYAWVTVMMVPLVALGKIPLLGAMKMAEQKTSLEFHSEIMPNKASADTDIAPQKNNVVLSFFIPLLSLIFFTWYFDIDILKGVIVALGITILLIFYQKLLKLNEVFDTMLEGFKSMLLPLGTVVAGFMLKEVNDQLGLTNYVIDVVKPWMTPLLLPFVVFCTMGFIAFATASFWGIFAIAIPIVIPLAISMDANIPLVIGALISASAFGSHACFYGDSTVLSAHGSGCGVVDHALTQLPYTLLSAAIAACAFIIVAAF